MIIALGGRMGSGKDTVGQIIQFLTAEDVGPECIKRIRGGLSIEGHHNSTFQNKKFAGKLKAVGSLLTGISVEKFEDQDFKKTDLPNEWCYIENGYAAKNMTVREFLQKLGTEAMRDGLHTNVWVNALMCDYRRPKMSEYNPSNWIITDMRFPNEMEAVVERKGVTIRVIRPYDYSKGIKKSELDNILNTTFNKIESPSLHPSETALDDAEFDYTIENDGSIQDLIEKIRIILLTEKIIN